MKITVGIEEHLVKQVEVEIPDNTEKCDVAETAIQKTETYRMKNYRDTHVVEFI